MHACKESSDCVEDRTYIQRPVCVIHAPTNNLIFVHKDTSNRYFVGGKSLLCLNHSVRCRFGCETLNSAQTYHIKSSSHVSLMLLVMQKSIHSLPVNFNIINTHDSQNLIYFGIHIREQILLLFFPSARARRAAYLRYLSRSKL